MKRILSFFVALILVSSSFGVAFAQEEHISAFQQLINEGHTEILFQNGNFTWWFQMNEWETAEEAEKRFYEEHNKFLNRKIQQTQNALWERSASQLERNQNKELLKELTDAQNSNITFLPSENDRLVAEVKNTKNQTNNRLYSTRSFNMNKPWQPYKGSLNINQSFVENEFYFSDVTAFNSNRTYEHETQVYDTNYADYAGYWNSNMPRAYLDTQFLDEIDIFTVGSSDTSAFQANKKYTTYMSLRKWTSSSAWVIIKWQIGHRVPNWCHSTWCIYATDTSDRLTQWTAPFGISWVK